MPLLYEINTRAWLRELSEQTGKPVRLKEVPDAEIDRWDELGFSDVWLMGIWVIGPQAREIAVERWRNEWSHQIPSTEEDVHGSPFAIFDHVFDPAIATADELLDFKRRLNLRGIGLILDMVPNHLSLDAQAVSAYPSYFVQGRPGTPGTFTRKTKFGKKCFAHGRDPYFPPWPDTVQVDHRNGNIQEILSNIMLLHSAHADGFRCDMAMLVLPEVFERTWADFPPVAREKARRDFWFHTWNAIGLRNPYFVSIAEVYWDLEERLQEEGFDFTYHKPVYDLLLARDYPALQNRLLKHSAQFLGKSVHFLENHDEPRIASLLPWSRHRVAALLFLTLPGMPMLHDGQLEGRKAFAPIQMSKRLPETPDTEVVSFYERLLRARRSSFIMGGAGRLLRPLGLPGSAASESWRSVIATAWAGPDSAIDLALVNLGEHRAICFLDLEVPESAAPEILFSTHDPAPAAVRVIDGKVAVELEGESGQIVRLATSRSAA